VTLLIRPGDSAGIFIVEFVQQPRRFEWVGMAVALAIVGAVISTNLGSMLSAYDGGISTSAATFTLHGLLPYRDYWLLYGPLSGFVLAVPTAIFGPSVELARIVGFGVFIAEAAITYRIARVWASPFAAAGLAVSAVVMVPALLSLDVSAWPLAMTFALAGLYLAIGTRHGGWLVGLAIGLAFLCRLDVGAYALIGAVLIRDRRAVLAGFALIAVPFLAIALATTAPTYLVEQLIWFPLFGTQEFRSLPGLADLLGEPTATLLTLPILILPRLGIVLSTARITVGMARHEDDPREAALIGLTAFAALCQLQTIGRADVEHFAQAATAGILLLSIWFPPGRLAPIRFGGLAFVTTVCLLMGLLGARMHAPEPAYDRSLVVAAEWLDDATSRNEPVYVGLTSHQYTLRNPLIIYYLADRRPAVRDTMFNPGVTNSDWGQARMVDDLSTSQAPYLVLDRATALIHEDSNDSRIPGSTRLDGYIASTYHLICDLGYVVIQERNDLARTPPSCPTPASLAAP
jgi:hypothetical protein